MKKIILTVIILNSMLLVSRELELKKEHKEVETDEKKVDKPEGCIFLGQDCSPTRQCCWPFECQYLKGAPQICVF